MTVDQAIEVLAKEVDAALPQHVIFGGGGAAPGSRLTGIIELFKLFKDNLPAILDFINTLKTLFGKTP